ncbi:phospholipase D family protein [Cohnella endophytica]|uniref:phospholipase D n=1 Tax=Cohnella endophytica TaxID=2419778 RepID=A0A494XXW7_9BACL|nr:phospholipase D family protein [Cohnella endophytica]RKP55404.1 phospholipase D family protein [Cohnella endophytica]
MHIKKLIIIPAITLSLIGCSTYVNPTTQNSNVGGTDLEWAFTKSDQHPEKLLISVIDSAKSTLDVAIYSLTYPDIVDAIKNAKKRGVKIRLITDKQQSGGKTQTEALKLLGSAGVPMKINKHSGLMHLKMVVADNKIATTGSFNYSKAASTTNDEVLMVIRKEEVAKSFAAEFEAMWNDDKGFKTIEPKIAQP